MTANQPPANHEIDPFPLTLAGDRVVKALGASRAWDTTQRLGQRYYPTCPSIWKRIGISDRMHPTIRAEVLAANRGLVPFILPISEAKQELIDLCRLAEVGPAAMTRGLREIDGEDFAPGLVAILGWLSRTKPHYHPTPKAIAWARMKAAELRGRELVEQIARRYERKVA